MILRAHRHILPLALALAVTLPQLACKTRELGSAPGGATTASAPKPAQRVLVFSDDFNRAELGPQWRRGKGEGGSGQWTLKDGALHASNIKNDALWLQKPLPERVRVEFEATALSADGDLKVEIFGDGGHHESGYIIIFGGWKNALDVIARLDEHGEDRIARPSRRARQNHPHKLAIERDGDTLRWFVDDQLVIAYADKRALRGPEHRFFAFNDWTAPVRFDNLKVYELR